MIEYTFNFLKVKKIAYFARVTIFIQPNTCKNEVLQLLPAWPDRDNGEFNGSTEPMWVQAALEGIEESLQKISEQTDIFYRVHLTNLKGSDVDTNANVVKCAAALAVYEALEMTNLSPSLIHSEGQWSLTY